MHVLLEIEDSKSGFILEMLSKYDYVKTAIVNPMQSGSKKKTSVKTDQSDKEQSDAEEWEAGFRESLRELKLYKEGKLELRNGREVLDEL